MKGLIFDLQRASYVDGPGIRTTVFFKGCNLKCAWCHNPESQCCYPQMMFYKDKCTDCGICKSICENPDSCTLCGKCALYCPNDARRICGNDITVEEVFNEIAKDISYYENSGGGVTFSGGECMLQIDFLKNLLIRCKENGINTAIDTAGNVPYAYFEKILPYTDIFLYDIKCMDTELHKKYTGTDNVLILDNLKRLLKTDKKVIIRIPIICGINDNENEMTKIKNFLNENGKAEKIELLPYHSLGENKYYALNMNYKKFTIPSKDQINSLKNALK